MEFNESPSKSEPFNRSECPWAVVYFTKITTKGILKLNSNFSLSTLLKKKEIRIIKHRRRKRSNCRLACQQLPCHWGGGLSRVNCAPQLFPRYLSRELLFTSFDISNVSNSSSQIFQILQSNSSLESYI